MHAGLVRARGAIVVTMDSDLQNPPEDLPRLFDRFWRGASARGSSGSGLGLAIVKQVAEAHGGSVDLRSEPGRGSTFTLRLPEPEPT